MKGIIMKHKEELQAILKAAELEKDQDINKAIKKLYESQQYIEQLIASLVRIWLPNLLRTTQKIKTAYNK